MFILPEESNSTSEGGDQNEVFVNLILSVLSLGGKADCRYPLRAPYTPRKSSISRPPSRSSFPLPY
jgi:hypothetical protein